MPIDRTRITFWFDGVSSVELGIVVSGFPSFSGAKPRVTKYSVPGRNGDLTYWDGSYENVSAELKCYVADANRVETALTAVNRWLVDCGYKEFVISSEFGRYRMARITNAAEIAIRMGVLAPFAIKLDCKPQRFYSGETPTRYSGIGGSIFNPTQFPSLPLLRCYFANGISGVTGTESITISNEKGESEILLNMPPLDMSIAEYIDVDFDTKSAHSNDGTQGSLFFNKNSGFPVFCSGETIFETGNSMQTNWFDRFDLFPRWWTL